ncbi:MAG: ribonuclease [Microbacteriaceae bacterium]|nr:ribonuclease [Microbacteriaceae bacterium]
MTSSLRLVSPAGELAAAFAALRDELGLVAEFPSDVEAEALRAVADLRLPAADGLGIPFVTIDPEGATDLDQALHLERQGDGYRVWYAIADVSAFVAPGGAIDTEARRRGTTMYAPDGRIPLHPTRLSEDAASLLPGQPRAAFVWVFELDSAADVASVMVSRSRVQSRRQYSYAEVQSEIDASTGATPVSGTASEAMSLLKEVGEKRIELERARGGASLNRPDQEVSEVDHVYRLERRKALPVEGWNAQLSLMTGMAAAKLMLDAGVGILRTMPAPDAEAVERFRRQAEALGSPWAEGVAYGEYLRSLDSDDSHQLAIIHAAASLFRGAGYTVVDGTPPETTIQAAVGAPYAHATAPIRRLVDRFALIVCDAICAGTPIPDWVREALPALPGIMARSDDISSRLDHGAIDAVEAAILRDRVGDTFDATVISAHAKGGVIQLADPAVTADCDGALEPGTVVRATLVTADVTKRMLLFSAG